MAYDKALNTETTQAKDSTGTAYTDYKAAFDANSVIEEKIGLSLAKNSKVADVAKNIAEKSKVPVYDTTPDTIPGTPTLNQAGKDKIKREVDTFGGARAFAEGLGTLGGSVFAVMNEIEKDSATKTKYSKVAATTTNPRFGVAGDKKPEFDKPLAELKWDELKAVQGNSFNFNTVTSPLKLESSPSPSPTVKPKANLYYDDLSPTARLRLDFFDNYRRGSTAAANTATALTNQAKATPNTILQDIISPVPVALNTTLRNIRDNLPSISTKRTQLRTDIKTALTDPAANDALKAQLGALYDIVIDEHTSGDSTNIVQLDKDASGNDIDNEKNRWIKDTITAGKPIISGPSGHTLRYLNFWAEKRDDENKTNGSVPADWPSLEAARLVMMADLMPPKHHSYDEIMTSSIGITAPSTTTLAYKHKSSYLDLAVHEEADAKGIARDAYVDSGAYTVKTEGSLDTDKPTSYVQANEQGLIDAAIVALNALQAATAAPDPKITAAIAALTAEKGNV